MAGVVLVLGLIAAGIYTDNVAFYWVAGTLGVLTVLLQIFVLGAIKSVKTQIDRSHDSLFNDDFFRRGRR